MFAVCRALGDLSEQAFCPLHIAIARLRGRLKACCGIKLGLGWFRHTKGRLLYFKSDTVRVRPPLQLAMVLRRLSSRLEAGKLQIGTLRADDSHRVKPDAFQATSYLDLCPLNCSLPSSPVESQ